MTPEEKERWDRIDRSLEYVAATMARLAARQEEHSRQIEEHSRQIEEQSKEIEKHSEQIRALSAHVEQLTDVTMRVVRIVEEQARRSDDFDHRLKMLLEAGARTDERLNTLITVVERYFSNGKK
jgi:methyl-accepting chemotaxis protein